MEGVIYLSTQISLLTQELQRRQLANDEHQKIPRQGWNPCMPMGQVHYAGSPYLNTYDSGCQYHPYLSWETNQDVPQSSQANESNLERVMTELANSMAEMKNYQAHMAISSLEEAMVEMAKSQIEFANS